MGTCPDVLLPRSTGQLAPHPLVDRACDHHDAKLECRRKHSSPLCSLRHAPSSCVSPRVRARIPATVGGRRDLTIYLFIPGAVDAGAIDSGASEAGQPPLDTASTDAGPVVDASALDSRFGPDALASDGGSPDVPLSGDGGGLDGKGGTGGTGGPGGTGGTSSLDGAGGGVAGAGGSTVVGALRQASGLVDRRCLASSPHLRAQYPVHSTTGSRHPCPPTGGPGFVGGLETGATVTYSHRHETCIKLQG